MTAGTVTLSPEKTKLAERFAASEPGADRFLLGDSLAAAVWRWLPMLDHELVRTTACPANGYLDRADAVAAAANYRDACVQIVR